MTPIKGEYYNWKWQKERLVYLGKSRGRHQFGLIQEPKKVWCELQDEDLQLMERTLPAQEQER